MGKLNQCLLPKTRLRLDYPKWSAQQNLLLLQKQPPFHQKWKEKTDTINQNKTK